MFRWGFVAHDTRAGVHRSAQTSTSGTIAVWQLF
jgi:hypothetical protein